MGGEEGAHATTTQHNICTHPAAALASKISLGFSPGIRTHHNTGFSPWGMLSYSNAQSNRKTSNLAYHIAVRRDCDVDQPRNLAKSVTVE